MISRITITDKHLMERRRLKPWLAQWGSWQRLFITAKKMGSSMSIMVYIDRKVHVRYIVRPKDGHSITFIGLA